nr:uncharacterized protein LOC112717783 [Arachis hypogaea]
MSEGNIERSMVRPEGATRGESIGAGSSSVKEGVGVGSTGVKEGENKGLKVSFRDKVIGASKPKPLCMDGALVGDRLATVQGKQGDSKPPSVTFSEEGLKALAEPYLGSIVIKVLGKPLSYSAMVFKLKHVWRLHGGYEVMDVGFGYFMIKCDLIEDREKILLGGLWMIQGYNLAVKPWSPSFHPNDASFGTTLVWIRISGLNILFYQEEAMHRIAAAIGNPIKIDLATKEAERGRFTRACVEIDLGLPVVTEVLVNGSTYCVEYESLDLICGTYRCYGHVLADCKTNNKAPAFILATSSPKETPSHQAPLGAASTASLEKIGSGATVVDAHNQLKILSPAVYQVKQVFEFGAISGNDRLAKDSADFMEKNVHANHVLDEGVNINNGWTKVGRKDKAIHVVDGGINKGNEWNKVVRKSKAPVGPHYSNGSIGPMNNKTQAINKGGYANIKRIGFSLGHKETKLGSNKVRKGVKANKAEVFGISEAFSEKAKQSIVSHSPLIETARKRHRPASLQSSPVNQNETDATAREEGVSVEGGPTTMAKAAV